MMKKLLSLASSMHTMALLMLVFAFSIGYATIIENDYGTMTAKADIYNAIWFEVLLGLLALNLLLNIFKYKMYTIKKAPIFIFHIGFLVILFGAAITRFIGVEGSMHIREGQSASTMTSLDTFFTLKASVGDKTQSDEQEVYLSKHLSNSLESSLEVASKKVDVKLVEYIPDAIESFVEDKKKGHAVLNMMVTDGQAGEPLVLKEGDYKDNGRYILNFGSKKSFSKPVINIYMKDEKLFMKHSLAMKYLKMDDRSSGTLKANDAEKLSTRTLYTVENASFVLRKFSAHAITKLVSNPNASPREPGYDVLKFKISVDDASMIGMIRGRVGSSAKETEFTLNGVKVSLSYGAKTIKLPFAIKLKDFELQRYPGSMSPSSYASEVVLEDKVHSVEMPYKIYMNHILDYMGYRFFQSSYDQDERGTILSVNNDPGTLPSYIGYFLLALGLFWSLLSKKNRFSKLSQKAKKASAHAGAILFAVGLLTHQTSLHADELDPTLQTIISFDRAHANEFGKLIVQDHSGRMKPLNTLANEIVAKIYRGSSIEVAGHSLNANQILLGMMVRPDAYRDMKIIRTKSKEINKLIGAKFDAKYASFSQFFLDTNSMRGYKLAKAVNDASRKSPKYRNMFDKEVLKVDERVNVAYMVFTGSLIKIWPKHNDVNNKWFGTIEALQTFEPKESKALKDIAINYFTSVDSALKSHKWDKAKTALAKIAEYQHFYGSAVYPSKNKINAEVFYNKTKIFERIYPLYFLVGFLLLVISFVKILKPTININFFSKVSFYILIALFAAHTLGLAIRWYIAGHAPWSDGYESMIYIGWATVLAGFIFSKRSPITMASTGILAGLILFVAHLNWMNPQVTNTVPVLKSYWLSIHVSMISGSYGFLGLGALLGFITILLFALKNEQNEVQITNSIKELNAVNEMSLIIGLATLTVGNFLGGVWANESWGRYWSWDPKETWALVTILVYAVVIHLRFIKSIYNEFNYSVISLLAFTSVLMTYFGVNYYLGGLHSYAKGDPVPIPDFVPISYAIIFAIIVLAYRNRKLA